MSMVCEVKLMLNQYVHENKRIERLYSILRQRPFFEMVVQEPQEEESQDAGRVDMKQLTFEPVLKKRDIIGLGYDGDTFFKCSVQSDVGLLGIKCDSDQFYCVDMATKKVILEQEAVGRHSNHWIVVDDQLYISLQTKKNEIKAFKLNGSQRSFAETEAMRVVLGEADTIDCTAFDDKFNSLVILKNAGVVEQRSVGDLSTVLQTVTLDEKVGSAGAIGLFKQLVYDFYDANRCAIAGGSKPFFILIDLDTGKQTKMTSKALSSVHAVCFIDTRLMAVASAVGGEGVEIWDLDSASAIRVIKVDGTVTCLAFDCNVLFVCSTSAMTMWDVRTWEQFYSEQMDFVPYSLHVSSDFKYLTVAGKGKDACVVQLIC